MRYLLRALTKILESAVFVVPATIALVVVLFILNVHPIFIALFATFIVAGYLLYRKYYKHAFQPPKI